LFIIQRRTGLRKVQLMYS